MNFSSFPSAFLLASVAWGSQTVFGQSVVVDDFTDLADHVVAVNAPSSSLAENVLLGVLGGNRTSSLTYTAVALPPNRKARVDIGYGFFNFSNDVGVTSVASLEYGATTPLNADLGSLESFQLSSWTLDQGVVDFTLSVTSGNTSESATFSLAASEIGQNYFFNFDLFPSINFSDVDRIALEFVTSNASQDASLSGFSVIPEPSTYALIFGGSIFGFVGLRRFYQRWLQRS